jgi:hypothetical protein
MFLGRHPKDTNSTIASRVVVDLGILAAIPLLDLVFAQIEGVVGPGGGGVKRGKGWDAERPEQGQRCAEGGGQHVRRSVEERARTATGKRGDVEYLGAPGGAVCECGVVLEFDRDAAVVAVVAEPRERVRVCVWVGLR